MRSRRIMIVAATVLAVGSCTADGAPSEESRESSSPSTSVASGATRQGSPRGLASYEQAVERLEGSAASEDGWLVYTVHIPTESGEHITWWMPPCDPASDEPRRLTATAYIGDDTMQGLDHYEVETYETECIPPSREIDVPPRAIMTDVDVVPVWDMLGPAGDDTRQVWAHDPDVERVRLTDPITGTLQVLGSYGDRATGPCVDSIHWYAEWIETHIKAGSRSCADTLGALPEPATSLLGTASPDPIDLAATTIAIPASPEVEGLKEEINDAVAAADWEALSTGAVAQWAGPCYRIGELHERSIARIVGSPTVELDIAMRSEPCTP